MDTNTGHRVRLPNTEELGQLENELVNRLGMDRLEAMDVVNGAYIAVWDNYITDCPGYAGKVVAVIYGGGVSMHEMYKVKDNKWTLVASEPVDA